MQSPLSFNDQQSWGGQRFRPGPMGSPTAIDEQDPRTFVPHGRQDTQHQPLPLGGVIASSSDDLFHPVSHLPSSSVYALPDVPIPSRFRAHNHSPFSRPLPHPSSFTSYNNPSFAMPPPPPPTIYHHGPSLPNPQTHSQPPFYHHQPAYIPPTYTQFLPPAPTFHLPQVSHSLPASVPVPIPSPSPSSSSHVVSLSKTLPTVTHIPVLTSKHDFFPWDEGVHALIRANGLIGHILDPSAYVDPSRPDLAPTPLPLLTTSSSPRDIEASNRWWAEDNIVQHVLVSRLGSVPRGLLPASNIITRTALSIYQTLTQYYGTCNFADCTELLNSLHNLACLPGRVPDFVSKWRIGLSKLQSARFVFNIKICISLFVHGLPPVPAFNSLRADLPRRIATIDQDQDYGAFINLTETVLELDTIFRSTSQSRVARAAPPSIPPAPSLPATSPPALDSSSRVPKKEQSCGNCKSRGLRGIGHTDGTCFQPGGGMEGRREEYMQNKGRVHAMLAECLENAFSLPDQPLPPDPSSPSLSPILSPALDSDYTIPPIANLCVTHFPINSDLRADAYIPCDPKFSSSLAFTSANFQSLALLSAVRLFNALLDSGCTHHIVRDRALFRNYVEKIISVGTANCGSLDALGSGDVEFRYPFGDRHVIFTLRGCLYAPAAPINLLSVGAFVEKGMSCLFSPGGITKVFYPDDHPRLAGFSFSATVANRLSFLQLDFLPPVDSVVPSAFPAGNLSQVSVPLPTVTPVSSSTSAPPSSFPRVKLDSMLWHRHFGHVGMDATRAALTKEYVTGVKFDGSFLRDYCISCIVGKSPQKSYPLRGNRAAKIGELLHMDLCGPFPVQAPRGEKYFYNILDDRSNWGFTFGLRLKSDAFSHYRATEAFLERSNDAVISNVRCGGELELTAGQMGDYFTSKGIIVQRTVPYAHQQNGKSERYIRTIEEGGQALLADAGLPMSFWLDAVLTRQYLVNRLPTSTLPDNVTPFEIITKGRKPDLSHLRVWGCDCYVAVPDELRAKAGPKRSRAIFVGYEEHRIGWKVRDLHGKYSFSNDVIFNEDISGRLGVAHPLPAPSSLSDLSQDPPSRPVRDRSRVRTAIGREYDEVLRLKAFRRAERDRQRSLARTVLHGGAMDPAVVDGVFVDVRGDAASGAVAVFADVDVFSPSLAVVDAFFSLIASLSLPDLSDTFSLPTSGKTSFRNLHQLVDFSWNFLNFT